MLNKYKKQLLTTFLLAILFLILFTLDNVKEKKISQHKQNNFHNLVKHTEETIKSLINEKQNATLAIAISLANNDQIISSIKSNTLQKEQLQEMSDKLNKNTNFKNVWIQIIDKNGYSLQRSWTKKTKDQISKKRLDLQKLLKDPKITSTISTGKFDMTFKSIVPIYSKQKEFLGLFEIITHFNSISKKIKDHLDVNMIALVDKSYKQQLIYPFSKTFIKDYYVANINADIKSLNTLKYIDIPKLIKHFELKEYKVLEKENILVSYHNISGPDDKPMGHFFMFHDIVKVDMTKIDDIKNIYNLYSFVVLSLMLLLFYIIYLSETIKIDINYKLKTILYISIFFIIISLIFYKLLENKFTSDINSHKEEIKKDTLVAYNSIYDKNKELADTVYFTMKNDKNILNFIVKNDRVSLEKYLNSKYIYLKKHLNIRQLHFHTKDSKSFLRMHKPSKYGDDLKGFRESVVYVNHFLKPFDGFEEGRVFNGFRYVYPLFDNKNHIGSVEISFSAKSFIDKYLTLFNKKKVNLLISKKVIEKKLFKSESSNYIQSPLNDFYYDKSLLNTLDKNDILKDINQKTKTEFDTISKKILKGNPFSYYFDQMEQLAIYIPLINKLNGEIIGSLNITNSDTYINKTKSFFYFLLILGNLILIFIVIFIYRELLSKQNLIEQKEYTNKILDSQKSLILVTNGKELINANDALFKFFGVKDKAEFLEKHKCICEYFQEDDLHNYLQKSKDGKTWVKYLLSNQNKEVLSKISKPNKDESFIFKVEIKPFDKQKDIYIITFVDITNIKQMENTLIQNEKMSSIANMIENIAHQWRQPLSIISTAASGLILQKEYGTLNDDEFVKTCTIIDEKSQYLSKTIDNFRNYIKGKEKEIKIDINKSIKKILDLLEQNIFSKRIVVNTNLEANCFIHSYESQFEQSIISILTNSIEALEKNNNQDQRYIQIDQTVRENILTLTITDNAGGIDPEVLQNVFDPYFTTKHQAIGVGLSMHNVYNFIKNIAKGDIKIQNSQIDIENKTYKATSVIITLPLEEDFISTK